jgi:hypothetical protein
LKGQAGAAWERSKHEFFKNRYLAPLNVVSLNTSTHYLLSLVFCEKRREEKRREEKRREEKRRDVNKAVASERGCGILTPAISHHANLFSPL